MGNNDQQEITELRKVSGAIIERNVCSPDWQEEARSLFQAPDALGARKDVGTLELAGALADLEKTNQELILAKEAAEQANSSKTSFLASASHDVLQPLNAALLLISTLNTVQTSSEGRKLCQQVECSLETMDALLRNLLYMSRLDAGDVKPHFQTVSLDRLFESIASDFEPIAQVRNLELRVKRSGLHVWSDPTMLRRTIQNIVANALRYTQDGGVLLIAGKRQQYVHVRIADTGVGIEKANYSDIFQEFQRYEQGQSQLDGSCAGMGLGLAIVERMIDTLNHSLRLNSKVGCGSCFKLILPHTRPPALPKKSTKKPSSRVSEKASNAKLSGARILIIENDLAALQAMEALLGQWGCGLRLASTTREAMSALNSDRAWIPEIIVADQHLANDEKGTSVVRIIRQLIGQQIPAVIVTADPSEQLWRMADQRQLEVMQKPCKPAQLRALLTHLRTSAFELSA